MKRKALWIALTLAPLAAVAATSASAAELDCKMTFTLSGWSAIYQTASGTGVVTCENGQTMDVAISAKGGGLTVGKYKIDDGKGTFSDVTDISQVLGSYAQASAHAGAVGSVHAAAMTKGPVSLALTGTGGGFNSEVQHLTQRSGAGAVACAPSPASGVAHGLHAPEPRRTLSDSVPAQGRLAD